MTEATSPFTSSVDLGADAIERARLPTSPYLGGLTPAKYAERWTINQPALPYHLDHSTGSPQAHDRGVVSAAAGAGSSRERSLMVAMRT